MNLVLFGFKGCGKTYFGKRLAEKMRWPFIDTDDLLAKEGTPKELYCELGEMGFRALEKEVIRSLEETQNSVLAVGGGAVLDPENVSMLQKLGPLVYLKASPELLQRRIMQKELPAILDEDDPIGSFFKMVQERLPLYEAIAMYKVDVEALDEAAVLTALRSILILEEPDGL